VDTTLIAAEKTGRIARLLEYDPLYCDTIVRRWERFTGKKVVHVETGATFEDVEEQRLSHHPVEGVSGTASGVTP